jgi:hypothetical protein
MVGSRGQRNEEEPLLASYANALNHSGSYVDSPFPEFSCHFSQYEKGYQHQKMTEQVSNGQYIQDVMTHDQDFQDFRHNRLEEKSALFCLIQGRADSQELCDLTEEYYQEHSEKLGGRHCTDTDYEMATHRFTQDNANNCKNVTVNKMIAATAIGIFLECTGLSLLAVGIGSKLGSLATLFWMDDGDEVSTGDLETLKKHHS